MGDMSTAGTGLKDGHTSMRPFSPGPKEKRMTFSVVSGMSHVHECLSACLCAQELQRTEGSESGIKGPPVGWIFGPARPRL